MAPGEGNLAFCTRAGGDAYPASIFEGSTDTTGNRITHGAYRVVAQRGITQSTYLLVFISNRKSVDESVAK